MDQSSQSTRMQDLQMVRISTDLLVDCIEKNLENNIEFILSTPPALVLSSTSIFSVVKGLSEMNASHWFLYVEPPISDTSAPLPTTTSTIRPRTLSIPSRSFYLVLSMIHFHFVFCLKYFQSNFFFFFFNK